eukprot:g19225.t1
MPLSEQELARRQRQLKMRQLELQTLQEEQELEEQKLSASMTASTAATPTEMSAQNGLQPPKNNAPASAVRSNSSSSRFRSSTAKRFHNALKNEEVVGAEEPDENHDALHPRVRVKEEPREEPSLEARSEEQRDIFAAAGRPVLQPTTTTVIRRSPTTTNGFPNTTNYGFPITTTGFRRNPYEGANAGTFGQPFPGASQSNGNVGYGPARVTRNVAPLPLPQQGNGQVDQTTRLPAVPLIEDNYVDAHPGKAWVDMICILKKDAGDLPPEQEAMRKKMPYLDRRIDWNKTMERYNTEMLHEWGELEMITVKDFEFVKPAVRAGWTELDLSKEWDAFRVYKIGVIFTLWSYFEALWAQANVSDDIKGVTRSAVTKACGVDVRHLEGVFHHIKLCKYVKRTKVLPSV